MAQPTVYAIPVCPFSQRLRILLALKGQASDQDEGDLVRFEVVDITKPRAEWLLQLSRGTTALPIMDLGDGRVIKESLVIMQYLEDHLPLPPVAQPDPYRRAVENMLCALEGAFCNQGYGLVLNQQRERRASLHAAMLQQYARLNAFLLEHAPRGPFLFDQFGWAEAVFTPLFMRFWFLDYYEDFDLPDDVTYARVRQWRDACLAHPAAQQTSKEEVVKFYYDYAKGMGNGGLLSGRKRSSFVFEPDWRTRPWPSRDKYGYSASDEELGL